MEPFGHDRMPQVLNRIAPVTFDVYIQKIQERGKLTCKNICKTAYKKPNENKIIRTCCSCFLKNATATDEEQHNESGNGKIHYRLELKPREKNRAVISKGHMSTLRSIKVQYSISGPLLPKMPSYEMPPFSPKMVGGTCTGLLKCKHNRVCMQASIRSDKPLVPRMVEPLQLVELG